MSPIGPTVRHYVGYIIFALPIVAVLLCLQSLVTSREFSIEWKVAESNTCTPISYDLIGSHLRSHDEISQDPEVLDIYLQLVTQFIGLIEFIFGTLR